MLTRLLIPIALICLLACDKRNKDPQEPDAPPPYVPPADTSFKCGPLPPPPSVFGWKDSITDPNKNIRSFFYNPANPDEVIYIVFGDVFGGNKMYTFHVPGQTHKFLANTGSYLPQVNKSGWIVFSDPLQNLYKIKTNGDSLTQLTNDKSSVDPKWDYSGKAIYYFRLGLLGYPPQIIRISADGSPQYNMPAEIPNTAPLRKSKGLVYIKTSSNVASLIYRDSTNSDKILFTSSFQASTGQSAFGSLTVDQQDRNLYWWNEHGIIRFNLQSLKPDTVFKNCGNLKYEHPVISHRPDEMTFVRHYIKPVSSYHLYHRYEAVEMNLVSGYLNVIRIFP